MVPVVLGGGVPVLPTRIPGTLALEDVARFGAGLLALRDGLHAAPGAAGA
ncbi:MAG: hypothetical protein HHJ14_10630 [Cellulomonas sp.]|nr:hypothetical protein [Cellulomonas sp.]